MTTYTFTQHGTADVQPEAVALRSPEPRRRRVEHTTDRITRTTTLEERQSAFRWGWNRGAGRTNAELATERAELAEIRGRYGFSPVATPLLTPPSANAKLIKGAHAAYGLTIQSHLTTLLDGVTLNSCPHAGQCVAVCVLNNGNGRYDAVQTARTYRAEFLAVHTLSALRLIGAELAAARKKARKKSPRAVITFRPNVNSDLDWNAILGTTLRELAGVVSYGYSKRPEILEESGLTHEALSFSEKTTPAHLETAQQTGRPVAIVTNRRPKDAIEQWHPTARVVDADLTDEWMFTDGVIGDLSFKGSNTELRAMLARRRSFVLNVPEYEARNRY